MCLSKIKGFFGKPKPEKEVVAVKEKPPRKWWQFPVRLISTKRPGPNMPNYQPCSQCYAGSKRQEKMMGGANYFCHRHGRFFVRA